MIVRLKSRNLAQGRRGDRCRTHFQKEVMEMRIKAKSLFVWSLVAVLCVPATALIAQETEGEKGLRVGHIAVCTDVQNRVPISADTTFSSTAGTVYCFTRIEGATDTTSVTHVWYYGQKKMAEVTLPVQSGRWRTWSTKRIMPQWTGKWNVVVLSEDGDPLAQASFSITSQKSDQARQSQKERIVKLQ